MEMNIIKRSGEQVPFDKQKIVNAIAGANYEVRPDERLKADEIQEIAEAVYLTCKAAETQINVEDVQNYVEDELLDRNTKVAKKFIKYREGHRVARDDSHLKAAVKALLVDSNEEVQTENANKNATLTSTKRDLIAGEACKAIARDEMLPDDILEAHDKGLLHVHDMDYLAQDMYNCSLVNLEDMLQNGTVISDVMIETPKSFEVAANIMTQIISQVASSQYGGQSMTLTHLAPFVDVSRQKHLRKVIKEHAELDTPRDVIEKIAENRLKDEIKDAVQKIQYEIITNMTTNGKLVLPL